MKSACKVKPLIPYLACFFAICSMATSEAQHPSNAKEMSQRLIKLHYENSSGEKGITIFEYDANGIAQTATWKLLDGTRYSNNYFTYDPSGNLILKYREFSDGLISFNRYEYDEKNNLVKETFERSDSITGVTFYHYNQQSLLERADCRGLNGWFYGILEHEYSQNRKVGATILSKGDTIGNIIYRYNDYGNLEAETWQFQGGWNQHFRYEYEEFELKIPPSFTSSNVFITNTAEFNVVKEEYDFNGETGGPSYYEYGEDGRLVKKTFERSDTFKTVTAYTYDNNGLLTGSYREYSNGLTAEFNYVFDGNRRLINRTYIRSEGVSGSEKYFFNEKGWLVKGVYENFDSWLTGTIEFEHDKNGLISQGSFESKDGYTAEINFAHDAYGSIIWVHWDFSFGKTQTYTFEYHKIN